MRRLVFAPIAGALTIACASFGSSGTPATDANDGAATAIDGGTPDAAETAPASEAGADAGPFCAPNADPHRLFCADFDESDDVEAGWDALITTGNQTTVGASSDVFDSAPHAFHARIAGGSREAALQRAFTLNTTITVALDVLYPSLTNDVDAEIATVRLTNDLGEFNNEQLFYAADATDGYFEANSADNVPFFSNHDGPPTVDTWHHIEITLTNDASDYTTVDTSFDGVRNWENHQLPFRWSGTIYLSVGLADLYMTTSGEAYVDNVLVTGQ